MHEDKIIDKLLEHDERLDRIEETMVTKKEFGDFVHEYQQGQDKIIKMLTNIQAEQAALMPHEGRIDALEDDVKKIKLVLKMA